jgi:predicted nucleic acid-binding protein
MDKTIAQKAGEVRRKFNVPFADSIIAATTLHFGTKTLVTKNIKHYKSIKDIKIKNPY